MEQLDSQLAGLMDRIYFLPANSQETEEIRDILHDLIILLHQRTSLPD